MDEEALDRAKTDLVAWGLLEVGSAHPQWTRRFRAAVMRQAMRLAEEERAGHRPHGAPLLVSVALALADLVPTAGELHVQLLYATELDSLPPAVQAIVASTELPLGPRS